MIRYCPLIFIFGLTGACRSTEPLVELAAETSPGSQVAEGTEEVFAADPLATQATPEASSVLEAPSCDDIPSCSSDENQSPYSCVAYRYQEQLLWEGQRVYGWGSSLCEAKRAVAKAACDQGKDFSKLADLSCSPDASFGKCPVPPPKCPKEGKPTKCLAQKYQGEELSWELRPTAWGRNECETRYLVQVRACEQGLEPQELSQISCETDSAPGQCPPAPPLCELDDKNPTECVLSSVGDMVFKKPWRAIGTSVCEARHQLQGMLCRFADSKRPIANKELKEVECRGLAGSSINISH